MDGCSTDVSRGARWLIPCLALLGAVLIGGAFFLLHNPAAIYPFGWQTVPAENVVPHDETVSVLQSPEVGRLSRYARAHLLLFEGDEPHVPVRGLAEVKLFGGGHCPAPGGLYFVAAKPPTADERGRFAVAYPWSGWQRAMAALGVAGLLLALVSVLLAVRWLPAACRQVRDWVAQSENTAMQAIAFFVFALVVRCVYYAAFADSAALARETGAVILGVPYSDAQSWDLMAEGCAEGRGLQGSFGAQRPFFSISLAAVYVWFGASHTLGIALNIFVSALTAALVYLIGAKVASRAVGSCAALFVTFEPTILRFNLALMSETLGTFFFVWSVYALLVALEKGGRWAHVGSGVLLGLANLTRTLTLPAFPAYCLCAFVKARSERRPAVLLTSLLVVGVVASVGPWIARQYCVHGITGISDNMSACFYAATSPTHRSWNGAIYDEADAVGIAPTVKARYDYFMLRALENLRDDPAFYGRHVAACAHAVADAASRQYALPALLLALAAAAGCLAVLARAVRSSAGDDGWRRARVMALLALLGVFSFALWRDSESVTCASQLGGFALGMAAIARRHQTGFWVLTFSLAGGIVGIAMFGMGPDHRLLIMIQWLFVLFQIAGIWCAARVLGAWIMHARGIGGLPEPTMAVPCSDTSHVQRVLWGLRGIAAAAVVLSAVRLLYLNYAATPAPNAPLPVTDAQRTALLARYAPPVADAAREGAADTLVMRGHIHRHLYRLRAGQRVPHWSSLFRAADEERTYFYLAEGFQFLAFKGWLADDWIGREVAVICRRGPVKTHQFELAPLEALVVVPWHDGPVGADIAATGATPRRNAATVPRLLFATGGCNARQGR